MKKRILSIILSGMLALTVMQQPVLALEMQAGQESDGTASIGAVSISEEGVTSEDAIPEDSTENSTTFDLGRHEKMTVFYGENIRFEDENGELKDYDPQLVELYSEESLSGNDLDGYAYENEAGDMKAYVPESIGEETPLLLEKEDMSVGFSVTDAENYSGPVITDMETANGYEEVVTSPVSATYTSDDVSLQYISQTDGIKENVIFGERPSSSEWVMEMELEDAEVRGINEEGGIDLTDEKGKLAGGIEAPFMIDAEGAYSDNAHFEIRKDESDPGKYEIKVVMDDEWLRNAAYPVTLDPSFTWIGNDNLRDVFVKDGSYADTNYNTSAYSTMWAGRNESGIKYRTFIHVMGLKTKVKGMHVDEAKLYLYQRRGGDSGQTVKAYRVTENWKSSLITWNNQPQTASVAMDTIVTSSVDNEVKALSITSFARKVANGSASNFGFMLRNTSGGGISHFYGSRTPYTSYRPKVTVIYHDGPTQPESVAFPDGSFIEPSAQTEVCYEGIETDDPAFVQYRVAKRGEDGSVTDAEFIPYSESTKVAAAGASGSFGMDTSDFPDGKYRVYVRGIDGAGITGTALGKNFTVDSTAPVVQQVQIKGSDGEVVTTSTEERMAPKDLQLCWKAVEKNIKKIEVKTAGGSYENVKDRNAESSTWISRSRLVQGRNALYVRITDQTGHVASASAAVWIDREGPVITAGVTPAGTESSPSDDMTPLLSWSSNESASNVMMSVDGGNFRKIGTGTSGEYRFAEGTFATQGRHEIKLKGTDILGNKGEESTLYFWSAGGNTRLSSFLPQDLSAEELYGKAHLSWEAPSGCPEGISYSIYKSDEASFTPSEETLIAGGLKECTFTDMDVSEPGEMHYRIAVVSGSSQLLSEDEVSCSISEIRKSTDSGTGNAFWLSREAFETPCGDGSVEKRAGDLMYSQSDFELSAGGFSYGLERTYNSELEISGMLGSGWTDSWHEEIYENGDELLLMDETGAVYSFEEEGDTYECMEEPGRSIVKTDDGWLLDNGSEHVMFNAYGVMTSKEDGNENTLSFIHDEKGDLEAVVSMEGTESEKRIALERDESGALQSVTLPDMTTVSFVMQEGELTSVRRASEDGRESISFSLQYDSGKLTRVSDACGNQYSVTYDDDRAAEAITCPDGSSVVMTRSGDEDITCVTEKRASDGNVLSSETALIDDQTGKVLSSTDAAGNVTEYSYDDENGLLETQTLTQREWQTYEDGRIVSASGRVATSTEYDDEGRVEEETDEDGTVTSYEYEDEGEWTKDLITSETESIGDDVISETDFEYDENGNCIRETESVCDEETITQYDEYGNEKEISETKAGILIQEESLTCDADGNIRKDMVESADTVSRESAAYDEMGRPVREKDLETGAVTQYELDFLGRVVRTVMTDSIGTKITTCAYDDNGALISETDEFGNVTTHSYDQMNRITESRTSSGSEWFTSSMSYGYSAPVTLRAGSRTVVSGRLKVETVSENGHAVSQTYTDGCGNEVRKVNGGTVTDCIFDSSGNVISEFTYSEDAEGLLSVMANDRNGNVTCRIDSPEVLLDGYAVADVSAVTLSRYDDQGRIVSETDPEETTTEYAYDEEGRTIQIIEAAGSEDEKTSIINYIENEETGIIETREITAGGTANVTLTDAAGNVISEELCGENDLSQKTEYEHDDRGNVTEEHFGNGTSADHAYDIRGRKVQSSYYDAGGDETLRTSYVYDEHDQLTEMRDHEVVNGTLNLLRITCHEYDQKGRLASEYALSSEEGNAAESEKTRYEYNAAGDLVKLSYPEKAGGGSLIYEYDGQHRVTEISAKKGLFTRSLKEYEYDSLGRITETATNADFDHVSLMDDKLDCSYSYDEAGRVTSIEWTEDGSPIEKYSYAYDKLGRVTEKIDERGSSAAVSTSYSYDPFGQLIRSSETEGSETKQIQYSYDLNGNRIKKTEADKITDYEYDSIGRLTEETVRGNESEADEALSDIEYSYDGSGNEISARDAVMGRVTEQAFDSAGRLVNITISEGDAEVLTQYNGYDGEGRRISRSENTGNGDSVKVYEYSRGSMLFSFDNDGNAVTLIPDASGETVAMRTSGAESSEGHLVTKDHKGSIMSILEDEIACEGSYEYGDFGETEIIDAPGFENQICHAGDVYDESTGLYYLNARLYSPETGRFLSADTYRGEVSEPDTWNLYVYCKNDPIDYIDPSGHRSFSVSKGNAYAKKYYSRYNGNYPYYPGADCTNFASQILHAGGILMTRLWHANNTKSTKRWSSANDFMKYWGTYKIFKRKKGSTSQIYRLTKYAKKGDFIAFDKEADGKWNHLAYVTNKCSKPTTVSGIKVYNIKVAQHTSDYHAWLSNTNTNGWVSLYKSKKEAIRFAILRRK